MKKLLKKALELILPFVLGGFILFWLYRDFDFVKAGDVLLHATDWRWMLLSLLFGVFAQVFRGWRWRQTLEPLDAFPKRSDCVNAIFISYATSLVIPRIGELSRCGVLAKYDNVSFAKSLGTVVSERIVDTLVILLIAGVTILLQLPVFTTFFQQTGTRIPPFFQFLTSVWLYVILLCIVGVSVFLYCLRKTLPFYERMKRFALNVWKGILSLRSVRNVSLFVGYTLGIWLCYYLHFYFTFHCFAFTSHLGIMAAMVMFICGTFAVIVPTPNGAGTWHFAVISMMTLYGINATNAGIFALIVHGIQTFLVVLLGIYGLMALLLTNRRRK